MVFILTWEFKRGPITAQQNLILRGGGGSGSLPREPSFLASFHSTHIVSYENLTIFTRVHRFCEIDLPQNKTDT